MGKIKLEYIVKRKRAPINVIVSEFEYGSTFALYNNREEMLPSGLGTMKWVEYDYLDGCLSIWIDDSFWIEDFFFEKFFSICLYNLSDFGHIYLNKIELSQSNFNTLISRERNNIIANRLLIGTILKPYYHQTLKEKKETSLKFTELGCNLIKNDECYFLRKDKLILESKQIQDLIGDNSFFVPNITSYIHDFDFVKSLFDVGIKIFMVDYLIVGFSAVYRIKKQFPEIILWGHRVGYDVLNNYISMDSICTLAQMSGIELLHVGTPKYDIIEMNKCIRLIKEQKTLNKNFKPIFTKTTPEITHNIYPVFGNDGIYMACGYFRDNHGILDWEKVKEWCNIFNK